MNKHFFSIMKASTHSSVHFTGLLATFEVRIVENCGINIWYHPARSRKYFTCVLVLG
jgi:hypothetical protein